MRVSALLGTVLFLLLPPAASATPILENGYDGVERMSTRDPFELRGGSLSIAEGGLLGRTATVLPFAQGALRSELRSGAIVAESDDILSDASRNPVNGLGEAWWVNIQASVTGKRQFLTASSVSVSNHDARVTILDALSQVRFDRSGERIRPIAAIDGREVWGFGADPSASIASWSLPPNGSSSSFGAPDVRSADANSEDRRAPRSVAEPERLAATLLGVAVAAAAVALRRRAKRAASRGRP